MKWALNIESEDLGCGPDSQHTHVRSWVISTLPHFSSLLSGNIPCYTKLLQSLNKKMQWKKKIQCSPSKPVRAMSSLPHPGAPETAELGRQSDASAWQLYPSTWATTPKWLFWEAHRWEEPHTTMLTHSRIQHTWAEVPVPGLSSSPKKMKMVIEGPRWALFMFY